jgi:hypothetical protein
MICGVSMVGSVRIKGSEKIDQYDDDNVYFKKITSRVSQNLILHKNADQPKA